MRQQLKGTFKHVCFQVIPAYYLTAVAVFLISEDDTKQKKGFKVSILKTVSVLYNFFVRVFTSSNRMRSPPQPQFASTSTIQILFKKTQTSKQEKHECIKEKKKPTLFTSSFRFCNILLKLIPKKSVSYFPSCYVNFFPQG